MYKEAISNLNEIVRNNPWAGELAGVLPLSAVVDFIKVPQKLHVLQLAGATPLWSWPVTPAGSRVLQSSFHTEKICCLDQYGSTVALNALDGRYGDQYFLSNPETVRMCISSKKAKTIQNNHANMLEDDSRIQNLELSMLISVLGWVMLLGIASMSAILECYLSLAFLIVVPSTGFVIFCLYGITPRRLLVENPKRLLVENPKRPLVEDQEEPKKLLGEDLDEYNRLIVVSEHPNAMSWKIFYGESVTVNSLLNRPVEPVGLQLPEFVLNFLRIALKILILAQWALALGAAALKDWNGYFITFWIFFSLNPDTFDYKAEAETDRTKFKGEAMKWIDPILASGSSRTRWQQATQSAMVEVSEQCQAEPPLDILAAPEWRSGNADHLLSQGWNDVYPSNKQNYWKPFIVEGIYMAAKIKQEAQLSGQKVANTV
ncbi:MAG: hypothetical protein M1829_000975 [Trizodia sp. TS-e1964]|nr:MAG: hypothetical protein M1829_000975 [Trizodia sp. TS-e1964]